MSVFGNEAQAALKNALVSSGACGGRVYDLAPTPVAYPWIEIGDAQVMPDDTTSAAGGSDDGVSEFIDLHVWSDSAARAEMKRTVDAIHGRLHGQSLVIVGRASALSWVRSVRQVADPDGILRHAVVTVEIVHRS
jgi:hypothetical protein